MDDQIRKLVEKKYRPRPSSVTPNPSDDDLREILNRVANSKIIGLSWNSRVSPKFTKRLEKLGVKLCQGNGCWEWKGATADNGERPQFRRKTAYLSTIAAWQNAPYRTYPDFDVDHICGNSLCVRPGLGHAMPGLRSIHEEAGKPSGARPKSARAKKMPKRSAAKKVSRPKAKP